MRTLIVCIQESDLNMNFLIGNNLRHNITTYRQRSALPLNVQLNLFTRIMITCNTGVGATCKCFLLVLDVLCYMIVLQFVYQLIKI